MKFAILLGTTLISLAVGWFAHSLYTRPRTEPNPINQVKPRPLDSYTIDNLSKATIIPSEIQIEEIVKEDENFTSYLFSMEFDPTLQNKEKKKITGLINMPSGEGPFPLIVMFRGYVDQKLYKTGDGTRRAGEYFAENGFATIAPDFLGYAGSDKEAADIFESRFQTYTTSLVLLKSLTSLGSLDLDLSRVSLWGHSNGGQIALTVLETTEATYPTVLWAPVSKPFPYSVLYYTDQSEDRGRLIRRELAKFEETYDPDLYSLDQNLDKIAASLSIHQGGMDDAVPKDWTDELNKKLSDLEIDLEYFVYPVADHNLNPNWDIVVSRSLLFFQQGS